MTAAGTALASGIGAYVKATEATRQAAADLAAQQAVERQAQAAQVVLAPPPANPQA